ncbi:hypothetical protein BS47DRAFT_1385701 [Hydnum rufescens UP504]|uniref:Uncharacterized protein n=1 Tax=Hydnum rufescens UP504 TaxID=1448309 RepID=A0A9P6AI09_9AGAM|nr:hypothetical protein BS47DRAFT_1385701 [Hydnum rufescens UP504]
MKTSLFFAAGVLLLPTLTTAVVDISWNVSNVPASGLTHIGFPFSIAKAPHEIGYFFLQQFTFVNDEPHISGQIGLQPRPDSSKNGFTIGAVFSSYIPDATTNDTNCHIGARGGAGVTCSVDFLGWYDAGYTLHVYKARGTMWTATVVNNKTDLETHVGSYTLPSDKGGIAGSQQGFVEYTPWDPGSPTYTSVTFETPVTVTPGSEGSLGDAREYGVARGRLTFRVRGLQKGLKSALGSNK